jgi:hypothetical protein
MSYKITGASPDSAGVVSISTTAESAEEAACIAQAWSDQGARNTAVTDPKGRLWEATALAPDGSSLENRPAGSLLARAKGRSQSIFLH